MTESRGGTEDLREAFASLSEGALPSEICPAGDEIWSASRGEVDPGRTRQMLLHTAVCGSCSEAWRLASEVQVEAGLAKSAINEPTAVSRRPAWKVWGATAALAAGVLLVIVTPRLLRESPPVTLRSGQEAAIRSLLEPGQRLSRDGFVLRWSGAPEGSTYTVQVVTANLDSLDEARGLAAAEYRVPPEKLSGLPAGAQVLWRVEARGPDGAHLDSATFAAVVE